MANKKIIIVKEHPRKVPTSKKNPAGITIVDKHPRHLQGTYLDINEIEKIVKNYKLKGLVYPKAGKLLDYPDADKYDDLIAIWTDYFNKKFPSTSMLDPDVVKALMGSESGFKLDPYNPQAIGIAQITKEAFKTLKEPNAEEIILEYKGLLKSTTRYKDKALKKYRDLYELLKK